MAAVTTGWKRCCRPVAHGCRPYRDRTSRWALGWVSPLGDETRWCQRSTVALLQSGGPDGVGVGGGLELQGWRKARSPGQRASEPGTMAGLGSTHSFRSGTRHSLW